MPPRTGRYQEAVKEPANVLTMAAAAALSAATLNPLPLLGAVVVEAAYLLFVPDSRWYQALLRKRASDADERRRQATRNRLLPMLRPDLQERFARLEETRRQIASQASGEEDWYGEMLRKLDYLSDRFLEFGSKETQFRTYLASVLAEVRGAPPRYPVERFAPVEDERSRKLGQGRAARGKPVTVYVDETGRTAPPPEATDRWLRDTVEETREAFARQVADVQRLLDAEKDAGTAAVLKKRVEVLQRRAEFVARIGGILTNINHQLQLLEDALGLINDELRARTPEQILADIDDVVTQTQATTSALDELAEYEQMAARLNVGT